MLRFFSYLPTSADIALKTKITNFPKEFGDWTSTEIAISERDYEILETRNLFVRDYKNKKLEISIYLLNEIFITYK